VFPPWNREVLAMQNLYNGFDFPTKTLLEAMCQGEFLKKYEDHG